MLSAGLILLSAHTLQSGDEAFPSDLDVLRIALERELSEAVPWALVPERIRVVEDGPENMFGWAVRDRIAALAISEGRRPFLETDESPRAELGFRIERFRFEHRKETDFFGFSPRVLRSLTMQLSLTLRSGDGEVLWLSDVEPGYEDRIPLSSREEVRVDGLTPELREAAGGGFGRALRATVVVGGIIYLLYTGGK